MQKYLFFLSIMFLLSCKTYYEQPKELHYSCVLEQSQFIESIQPILIDEGFNINKADMNRGFIIAEREISINDFTAVLNISIRYENTQKEYVLVLSSIKLPRDKNKIEYYDESNIRKEYEPYFKKAIERMKYFCKGGYYPNRP